MSAERVEPVPAVAAIESCEYRPTGDEHATLTLALGRYTVDPGTDLKLAAAPGGTHAEVEPSAVTIAGESVRVTFVVSRRVARAADHVLELLAGRAPALRLPAPMELPPIGWPGGDGFEGAVASTQRGEELSALVNLFERRATVAERVIADQREGAEYPQRLAQAYREAAELRSLLDSRESAHRDSAAVVEAAEAARVEHEDRAGAAERERNTLRAQLEAAQAHAEKLESKLAASHELLAEGDGRFDAQRTLYEARIASAAESDAKLRRRVDDLEARLGERRSTGERALETREARARALADAHPDRLSEVTLDEQRAQVAALERQLEQIRQRSPA